MGQIFHRSTNTIAKVSILGGIFILAGVVWLGYLLNRSSYATRVRVPLEQPVPFSHKQHVSGLGIDCRYCHTAVETSASAGIPPVQTCMNCHSQIWTQSPVLEPIRESFRTGRPVRWTRVHDLPDFVYFDHSIHVKRGVACATCHGRVDEMPLMWREKTLHMSWCLECHRHPERFVVPPERVFDADARPRPGEGGRLVREKGIRKMTDCSVCHR
jgi:hypothetical protein